jgi:hypothetical protein
MVASGFSDSTVPPHRPDDPMGAFTVIAIVPKSANLKLLLDFCRDIKRARHARFGPCMGDESGSSNLKSDGTAVLASCITLSKSVT